MRHSIEQTSASVKTAWTKRCQQQRDFLKPTPEVLAKNDDIAALFSRLQPAESNTKAVIPDSLMQVYAQHVPSIMPRLCKIIGTDWQFKTDLQSKSTKVQKPAARFVCNWNKLNQQLWHAKLTQFANRDDNASGENLPTASQLTMLEQDLRLLETMFNVIRNTNSENGKMAKATDLATIKKLDYLVFGREAYAKLGKIIEIGPTVQTNPLNNLGNRQAQNESEANYKNQPAFHGRYVDASGNYISAEAVSKAITDTKSLPKENLELVVVKMVPFRVAMRIDERKIGEFIASCENSGVPFHVTQTRINVHDPNEEIVLRGGRNRQSAKANKTVDRQVGVMDDIDNNSKSRTDSNKLGPVESRTNYDVDVEFYGYAKVFNPVDESRLAIRIKR